jgi:hypothetical protein
MDIVGHESVELESRPRGVVEVLVEAFGCRAIGVESARAA